MAAFASYPSLEDRVVLVTGGGSGIGAGIVAHFAAQRSKVVLLDRDETAAHRCADQVATDTGSRPHLEIVDLKDIDRLRETVRRIIDDLGPVAVLVNNAGNDDRLAYDQIEPDYWDDRFAVNLRHQFFLAQAVAPGMAEAGGGSIVNLGSISWMFGAPGLICYTTAKSAITGLTKSLARELGPASVRVNAIAPGWILTERQVERAKRQYPDKFDEYLTRQCLGEHLHPPDVARMALFLAADDSRLITGQTFIVDGGVV